MNMCTDSYVNGKCAWTPGRKPLTVANLTQGDFTKNIFQTWTEPSI